MAATVTVAMLGLTHPHSNMYLDTLDALDEVGAVALYDPHRAAAERIAAAVPKAAGVYSDLAALLARDEITHVVVAVPTDRSVAVLTRAIEAGKRVFTEKPGARSAAEFAPVLDALARRPVAFAVAYLNRWHPALDQARELCGAGALGQLLAVELRMVTTQVRFRDPAHWLFRKEIAGGGIVSWLGGHWLDMVRYLTGDEYASVTAQLATGNGEPIDVEDAAAVTFRLASGAIGSLHAGYLLASGKVGYEGTSYDMAVCLRGTLGAVTYQRGALGESLILESTAEGWETAGPRVIPVTLPPSRGYGGRHGLDCFRAFLKAGPDDATPAGVVDALRVLEVLDAIYAAGESGQAVAVTRRELPGRVA